jgi:hypothetical protein
MALRLFRGFWYMQSEISQLLDELFGSLEGVPLDEAGEDVSAMLHEEGE